MDTATLKPQKTEYKEVVYRSKSEARVAKYLDDCVVCFEYEPDWCQVDSWTPDFAIWREYRDGGQGPGRGRPELTIVEYKPRMVTETYLENLGEWFSELKRRVPFCCTHLWVGDFWDEVRCRYVFRPSNSWHRVDGWPGDDLVIADDIKGYRFDLEAQ